MKSHQVGFDVIWLVECKRWRRRVTKLHVLALREIVADVGADRGILLSEVGFQSGAVEAAKLTNVHVTSLASPSSSRARRFLIYFGPPWLGNVFVFSPTFLKGECSVDQPSCTRGWVRASIAPMFLRSNHRDKDGKDHTYWSLVETVRTPDGPRQRTLCYLGELNDSAQARWLKVIEVFNEQGERRQLKLFPSDVELPENDPDVVQVRVSRVRFERVRQLGSCCLGLDLWKRLELDRFWEKLLDTEAADVPWSRVAALLAINRLCAPASELGIEERWYPTTALDDLLGIAEGKINDTRLYRCLDRLLPHKTQLERYLKERYGELFGAEFDVLLYDLTSIYVEGQAEQDPLLQRGYSRDHRPDCKQVVIALIVNAEGFPLSYETFDGNRADVTTLETVMRMVERKYGRARRIWCSTAAS